MQKKYTVALCDILGFSDLVESRPLDRVVEDDILWFSKALYHAVNKEWPENVPSFDEINQNSSVGLAWFSDTILLFTREDEEDSLQELLQILASLIFMTVIEGTTRLRAGIAYGEAFIDPENVMYVGKPIIYAYQLEQQQQWSGAALTKSASERVPEDVRNGGFADWPIRLYDVPLKDNKTISTLATLAINWTIHIHDHDDLLLDWSKEWEKPRPEDWDSKPSICEKWQNTKQFHLDVCDQCRRLA